MDYNTILYFYLCVLLKCKGRIVMSYIVDIILRWRAQPFYWNEGAVSGVLCKNIFVVDLLGSQYLFEILQTLLLKIVKMW